MAPQWTRRTSVAGGLLLNRRARVKLRAATCPYRPPSMTEAEFEIYVSIPRELVYLKSQFGNLRPVVPWGGPGTCTIDQEARLKHAVLVARQTALKQKIRRERIMDRWYLRKSNRRGLAPVPPSPLTAMLIDEVIQDGKIVDIGSG